MTNAFAPDELGRGLIIGPGQPVPNEFAGVSVFEVDATALHTPGSLVDELHHSWVRRERVVIRLSVSANDFKIAARETDQSAPWQLGPGFMFNVQRLHFLVWNNNYDMRDGVPVWWWANKAVALGATPSNDGGDVEVDSRTVYCDGGPVQPLTIATIPYTNIQAGSLRPIDDQRSAAELAADQSAAVHHSGGPARIIAPAGSGKTRVLTERLRHVVNDWHLAPQTVCAVAYNTRAAGELTQRTSGLTSNIRTLNSLALAIVSGTGGFATPSIENGRRTMVTERDVRNILQDLVTFPRRSNSDPLAAWIDALSAVRLGLADPSDVEASSGDLDGFADAFDRYRSYLNNHNLLDFDEQIYRAIEVLLRDARARTVAQQQCRILLVDEFQDLTPAHVLMLRLLACPALDVFGVGDDDQVIYGYAGADPDYLVQFDKWFPGAASHPLEINYRCPPAIVEAATNLLTRNAVRVSKTITARPGRDEMPGEFRVEEISVDELSTRATTLITDWIEGGEAPESIALLTRVNVTLLPAQVLLSEARVPHTTAVDATLLKRTGIRTALAYLRIGADLDDISRNDISDTVRRPSRKIARNVVDMLTKRSKSDIRAIRSLAAGLSGNDGPRLDEYIQDLVLVADAVQIGSTADALDIVQNRIGLGEIMDVLDSSRREADRSTHADDLAALNAVAHLHPDAATFESWLNTVLSRNEPDGGVQRGVELATVHRVKGREWRNVVVYDASEGLIPHRLSGNRAEERRVFHVAITRASNQAVVLASKSAPSPFLSELSAPGEPEIIRPRIVAPKREAAAPKVDDMAELDENTMKLVEALKTWRREVAAELKVPAFTVFHDSHLAGIAVKNPSTLAELAKCRGVGETKLERWGDDILTVLERAV